MMRRVAPLIALTLCLTAPGPVGAAPLAGRWEGVFHGGRGDQAVVFVCRPRGTTAFEGALYMDGDEVGPAEHGVVRGDSLAFQVMNFRLLAGRSGDQMAFLLIVPNGRTHEFTVHFASADSTDLPAAAHPTRNIATAAWDQLPDSVLASHRLSPGSHSGAIPALGHGTLLLVGGGPTQPDLNQEFLKLAGGATARIVVITTAGDVPAGPTVASDWARVIGAAQVTVLHTASRKEADTEAFVKPLRDATAVWLIGGEAGRILVSYLGTRTERELIALLGRGGVIGGTSAGALVWGSECMIFRARADGSPYQIGDAEALRPNDPHTVCFGVLRNVLVSPHFTEFRMEASTEKMLAARPDLLAIGIDEATALEVHGDVGTVLGRGKVTVFDGQDHGGHAFLPLEAGARYDLRQRKAL